MTEKHDGSRGDFSADDRIISDRVQELTWSLFDDQISADELILLENHLLRDENARRTYVGCAQLHADLMSHFAASAGGASSKPANDLPVLGFLSGDSSLGLQSHSGEEAMQ